MIIINPLVHFLPSPFLRQKERIFVYMYMHTYILRHDLLICFRNCYESFCVSFTIFTDSSVYLVWRLRMILDGISVHYSMANLLMTY